jgi:hypothetical protein
MTKKDYELIAGAVSDYLTQGVVNKDGIAHILADYLKTDNPKFDRKKFLTACGVEPFEDVEKRALKKLYPFDMFKEN